MIARVMLGVVIVCLPFAFIGTWWQWPTTMMFIVYSLSIVGLASYIGRATESIAIVSGPRIGGLVNVTFGNAVELIITIFALQQGLISIVLASLTGAVIGNLLLVAGLSFFIGGTRYKRQTFNVFDARHNSGLLVFAIVVAFIFPAVFHTEITPNETMALSIWVAVIMLFLYFGALFFRLFTHRGVYDRLEDEQNENEQPEWSRKRALVILILATLGVAFVSESLVNSFDDFAAAFGWSELFIGVVVVAIIGNTAENMTAVYMAYKNKMNVSVEIAIGSTLQISMFVAPILVLFSLFFQQTMPLVFSVPELVAMVLAVLLTIMVINDGDSNWFEGIILLAAYVIMAVAFYLL